jgi:hypothetical protein
VGSDLKTSLAELVVEQLMLDRTLTSYINARDGAWERLIFKNHIEQTLLKAQGKLRSGLTGDEAMFASTIYMHAMAGKVNLHMRAYLN